MLHEQTIAVLLIQNGILVYENGLFYSIKEVDIHFFL